MRSMSATTLLRSLKTSREYRSQSIPLGHVYVCMGVRTLVGGVPARRPVSHAQLAPAPDTEWGDDDDVYKDADISNSSNNQDDVDDSGMNRSISRGKSNNTSWKGGRNRNPKPVDGSLRKLAPARITHRTPVALGHTVSSLQEAFRNNKPRIAWNSYRSIIESPVELAKLHPDDHTTMLALLCQHTLPSVSQAHAEKVVASMEQMGIQLDMRDYHALLAIHLRTDNRAKMIQRMHDMEQTTGMAPDVISFNLLLAAHARAGDMETMMQTWDRCVAVHPIAATLNMDGIAILIDAYGRAGDMNQALKIYTQLNQRLAGMGIHVGIVVQDAIIRVLGFNGCLDYAKRIFEDLAAPPSASAGKDETNAATTREATTADSERDVPLCKEYVYNDEHLYDAIIEACDSQNDIDAAEEYWGRLISVCEESGGTKGSDGSRSQVAMFIEKKQGRRLAHPLPSTYGRMIQIRARNGRQTEAAELFSKHLEMVLPDALTFEHMIRMYMRHGEMATAREVYDMMRDRGYLVDMELAKEFEE